MNRKTLIDEIKKRDGMTWDVIVIGGGATGLGVALDSITRGYSTLLLEQSDFAKATSSRSTKLVHGGVRYMAQGDILLVMEALHERGIMLKNAPGLTSGQEFIIPVYNLFDVVKYTLGLKFYDLLAGRLSLGKSYFLNRENTIARLPLLKKEGLKGGIVYHDGQFDDSRFAIALAARCAEKGGFPLNYFRVTGLYKDENNRISGVSGIDENSREILNFKSRLVINATGIFADEIARMDDCTSPPTLRPSQGVHIVLDKSFLGGSSALMIPETEDGRVLFAIPWYDEVVVGTTDTPLDEISLEPVALEEEINFILRTAGNYLTKKPTRNDILSVYAGLRPLAANNGKGSTKEVSRRHKITLSSTGLLSIVGGKWTTYRRMAEETINRAIKEGFLAKRECITKGLSLGVPASDKNDRLQIYGEGASGIKRMISENPFLGEKACAELPYTKAEILWICRNEMPLNIEDVLARRTRALFLSAAASMKAAPVVAGIMAAEFGYSAEWQQDQLASYERLIVNYI